MGLYRFIGDDGEGEKERERAFYRQKTAIKRRPAPRLARTFYYHVIRRRAKERSSAEARHDNDDRDAAPLFFSLARHRRPFLSFP